MKAIEFITKEQKVQMYKEYTSLKKKGYINKKITFEKFLTTTIKLKINKS